MKFIPNIIKYPAILRNKPIKNRTETIGFLLIIIKIPHNIEPNEIRLIKRKLEPFVKVSFKRNKFNIKSYICIFLKLIYKAYVYCRGYVAILFSLYTCGYFVPSGGGLKTRILCINYFTNDVYFPPPPI